MGIVTHGYGTDNLILLGYFNTTESTSFGFFDDIPIEFILTSSTFGSENNGCGEHIASDWQISTDTNFSNLIYDISYSTTSLTSLYVSGLSNFTFYYARVRYYNETGYSSWSETNTFRTIVKVPNRVSNILPISGSTNIDWENIISLTSSTYNPVEIPGTKLHLSSDWIISTDSNFENIVYSAYNDSLNLTTKLIPEETLGTSSTFYWKVRHNNIAGNSPWSIATSFITLPAYPNTPIVTIPLENYELFLRENDIISGNNYSGEGTHLYSDYQIDELDYSNLSGTEYILSWQIKSIYKDNFLYNAQINNTYGDFIGLLSGRSQLKFFTDYRTRVRYSNEKGYSQWSEYLYFKSAYDNPNVPYNISPIDESIDIDNNPTLTASTYSGMGLFLNSLWQISEDISFSSSNIVWQGILTTSNTNLTKIIVNNVTGIFMNNLLNNEILNYNKLYYWRVAYKNQLDYSVWSEPTQFTTKLNSRNIKYSADIIKKLEYLPNRFVHSHVAKNHPKFKEFMIHYLKFLDKFNNDITFNLPSFNTIKDFYEVVEIFDWADEIKNNRFQNFMSDNSLSVLKDIYFGSEINPEIIRFFRSMNVRKGSPISFQMLMKLLGIEVTISTEDKFEYKVTEISGKLSTTEEFEKFINVIKLFHPAGMKYSTSSELLADIVSSSYKNIKFDEKYFENLMITGFVLSTIYNSEITNSLITSFYKGHYTYNDFDKSKWCDTYGFQPYDLADINENLNTYIDSNINYLTMRTQRKSSITDSSAYGINITLGSSEFITLSTSDIIKNSDVTIEMWIKPLSMGGGGMGRIVDNGSLYLRFWGGTNKQFRYSRNDSGGPTITTATNTVSLGTWQHLALSVTSDGTSNFYINGILNGTENINCGTSLTGSTTYIGHSDVYADRFIQGYISNFRIWNTIRTQEQIQYNINNYITTASNLIKIL